MSTETILALVKDIHTQVGVISSRLDIINEQLTDGGVSTGGPDLSNLATKEQVNEVLVKLDEVLAVEGSFEDEDESTTEGGDKED